jgi:hypothetical protein
MTAEEILPLLKLDPWPIEQCIRKVNGRRYLVPYTTHWAHWHDEDAIKHHGIPIGLKSVETIRQAIRDVCVLHAWDSQTFASRTDPGKPGRTHFNPIEQFDTAQNYGGLI